MVDNTNRGVLFKNKNKKIAKHPDYTGTILISPQLAGKLINIAAWLQESGENSKKPGMKYMSLQVSEVKEKSGTNSDDFDDDLPF